MADSVPIRPPKCPPCHRNTVRHAVGTVSAIGSESCPSWAGTRNVSLETPHIPLGIGLREALNILGGLQVEVVEEVDRERCFRVVTPSYSVAIYPEAECVRSVWYDDQAARETDAAKYQKVLAYLARYGAIEDWELRMDNGWMRYWLNPSAEASMVYGVHMDVIRFNKYREAAEE